MCCVYTFVQGVAKAKDCFVGAFVTPKIRNLVTLFFWGEDVLSHFEKKEVLRTLIEVVAR